MLIWFDLIYSDNEPGWLIAEHLCHVYQFSDSYKKGFPYIQVPRFNEQHV